MFCLLFVFFHRWYVRERPERSFIISPSVTMYLANLKLGLWCASRVSFFQSSVILSDPASDTLSSVLYMRILSLMSVYSNCFLMMLVDLFLYGQRVCYRSKLGQVLLCGFQIYMLRWRISHPHLSPSTTLFMKT